MSKFTPTIVLDEVTLTKYREHSADSATYIRPGHSIEKPSTITINSDLPTPRKGNPGTMKTTVNCRQSDVLDEGLSTERVVPVICKVQTSFPVGCSLAARRSAVKGAIAALLQEDFKFNQLFYTGILPN